MMVSPGSMCDGQVLDGLPGDLTGGDHDPGGPGRE